MSTDPNLNDTDYELLSAYIDGVLSDSERSALEVRLRDDSLLRGELNALRQTVSLINQLPTLKAPRDFTLTPEMVGIRLVEKPRRSLVFPVLQFVSAVAAMVMIVFAVTLLMSGDNIPTTMSSEQAGEADVAFLSTQEAGVAFTNSGELSTDERLTAVFMATESVDALRSTTANPTQRPSRQSTALTLTALAEIENESPADANDDAILDTPEESDATNLTNAGGAGAITEMTLPEADEAVEADFDDSEELTATLVQTATATNNVAPMSTRTRISPSATGGFDGTTNGDAESVDDGSAVGAMAFDEAQTSMPPTSAPLPDASPLIASSPLPTMQGTPLAPIGFLTPTPQPTLTLLSDEQEEMAVTLGDTEITTSDALVEVTEEIAQEAIIAEATEERTIPVPSQTDEDDGVLAVVLLFGGLGLLILVAFSWWIPRRNNG